MKNILSKKYYALLNENRQKYLNAFGDKQTEKKEEVKTENTTETKPQETTTNKQPEQPKMAQPTKEQIEKELKSLEDLKGKIGDMDFKKFSFVTYPDSIIYEDHPKPQKYRCLNYIYKSIHNQTRKDT